MKKALARASAFFSEIRSCGTSEMFLRGVNRSQASLKYAYGVWGNEFYFTSTEGRYFTIHKVNYITFGGAEYFTRHGSFSVLMRFKIEDLKGSGRESPPAAGAGGASELRLTEESATRLMSSCPLFDFANKDSFFLVGGIIPTRG